MIYGFLLGFLHSELGFSQLCVCSVSGSLLHDVVVGGKFKRNEVIQIGFLGEDERHVIKSNIERLKGWLVMQGWDRDG